jgi:hypothetical protein
MAEAMMRLVMTGRTPFVFCQKVEGGDRQTDEGSGFSRSGLFAPF